jgi:Tfp pilus assembly protein PilF
MENTRSFANASIIDAGGIKPAGVLCALVLVLTLLGCNRAGDDPPETSLPGTPGGASAMPPAGDTAALQPILELISQRRGEAARAALNDYRQHYPDDGRAVFLYGLTYHLARDYAVAEPLFEQALTMDGSDPTTHHFLGWARFHQGDLEGARASFNAHLRKEPDEADSVFGLGLVEMQEGNFAQAEALFNQSIDLINALAATDPQMFMQRKVDLGKCNARIGEMAFEQGDYQTARDLLESALQHDPGQYTAHSYLSQIYHRLGNPELAAAHQTRYDALIQARGQP